ncbi:mechanosensitive ion channel domain-containing protein, partial [Filomicrobium insigne]|uniref:mechanosensitive ion channel domain-containing protein n=1 Tax=Filomicrobium insigne TaxID=418854 RepID=UPI000A7993BD
MAYIRIGSATPRLSDHQERLKALWAKLQPYAWETGIAAQFLSSDEVLARLDYASYFDLTNQPLPDNRNGIFDKLAADRLVLPDVGGKWNITNLGAILFAKRLNDFSPSIARKGVRFVSYDGLNRAGTVTHRQDGKRGYASGFKGLIDYIDGLLPHNEHIGKAFREERPLYPSIAIRELIANALIHQDMTITGTSPLIEMFKDRLEITNPGQPLVRPERFLDSPPRSRNEALASPRLLKDLVAAMLFLVAFAAVVSLFMGKGALGALAGSGLVLAMLGFAIRNVVADTLSGVALGIEGPFRIGDWVDIDGLARGAVIEIGWRTTRLLTRDRTYVILPNSQIARQRITNYSAPKPEYRTQVSI